MAQRIKGITIEINGDTTGLQKSLEKVDSAISNTRSELRDINKLLKLDPGNAELLAQKQKNLAQAITDTKSRLEQLKNAQAGVKEGTSDWDKLQREIISTEKDLEKLEKDYKNFGSVAKQQLQAVADKMAALGTKMQEVGSKLKSVGTTLSAAVTLPLVAAGTAAVKNFAEVDKTLQLVNSTMGNTAQQSKLITDAMKDAAANSVYGMSEAAEATLNFARAGLTAEQAAATLAPAMNLAAGEGGALETVSAGLVATINGFAGSFDEAAKYADVFANACNNSALDINSLSQAMSIAAPIFRSAGYSVKDAALYMGVMANAGIDANTAANSLKTGLARLVSPAKDAQGWIEKLGNTALGKKLGLDKVAEQMKNLTAAQNELTESNKKIADSENALNKMRRSTETGNTQRRAQISELRFKASDKTNYSAEERVGFLEKAQELEGKTLQANLALRQKEYELIKLKNSLTKSGTEDLDAENAALNAITDARTEYNEHIRSTQRQLEAARKEMEKTAEVEPSEPAQLSGPTGPSMSRFEELQQSIRIRVTQKPLVMFYLYAADDQIPALDELMYIISCSYSHFYSPIQNILYVWDR